MTKIQILIYCFQFLVFSYFILYVKWFNFDKVFKPLVLFFVFFIGNLIALLNCFADSYFFVRSDVILFLNKGELLYHYINSDLVRNFDILFEVGGGDPPFKHKWIAYTLDRWCNPSSVLIIKLYLFFGFLSSFHLVNISLFFAFISFISKVLLIRIFNHFIIDKLYVIFFIIISLLLGTDAFFVNGLHKETLGFFLYSFLFFLIINKNTLFSYLTILLILVSLLIVRNYIFVFFIMSYGLLFILNFYRKNIKFILLSLFSISVLVFTKRNEILIYFSNKINGFKAQSVGNLKIKPIEFDSTFLDFFKCVLIGLKNIFFYYPSHIPWFPYDPFLILNNIILYILIFVLIVNFKLRKNSSFVLYFWFLPSIFGLILIGLSVYNYGSILRYRSVFVFFIFIGLILNQKKFEFRTIFKNS